MNLLEVENLNVGYGSFQALFDISLSVKEGATYAIIGANGAGKSTLLKSIVGLLPPRSGVVRFDGREIQTLAAHKRVGLGISLVPEGRRVFPTLTVDENLKVGGYPERKGPWDRAAVYELLPLLVPRKNQPAGLLSGGEQQALAIGRALMANPRVLLLDEVSLGLAPIVVRAFYDAIAQVAADGMTILVVEQDIGQVLDAASEVACLLEGRTVLSGHPQDLTREQISSAYFGV